MPALNLALLFCPAVTWEGIAEADLRGSLTNMASKRSREPTPPRLPIKPPLPGGEVTPAVLNSSGTRQSGNSKTHQDKELPHLDSPSGHTRCWPVTQCPYRPCTLTIQVPEGKSWESVPSQNPELTKGLGTDLREVTHLALETAHPPPLFRNSRRQRGKTSGANILRPKGPNF